MNKDIMKQGHIYLDSKTNEDVEFKYMGQTGFAIVCEPGESLGGMQSSWGLDPRRLLCKEGGHQAATKEQLDVRLDYEEEEEEEASLAVARGETKKE